MLRINLMDQLTSPAYAVEVATRQKRDHSSRRVWPPEVVRAAREAKGLTQDQLATKLEVASSTIGHRESGRVAVYFETWVALTQVLGLPVDWHPPLGSGAAEEAAVVPTTERRG